MTCSLERQVNEGLEFVNISQLANNLERTVKQFCISFDMEWSPDEIIKYSADMVLRRGRKATWFVTHECEANEYLRQHPEFELGIHPNFNELMHGSQKYGRSAEEIVDRLMKVVPEARCVRSHSLTSSERLLDIFADRGLRVVSNSFIPQDSNPNVVPWKLWGDLTVVPHSWQDNVSIKLNGTVKAPSLDQALGVFDFHPVHVFLNTENWDRYESIREDYHNADRIRCKRFEGFGTASVLDQVLRAG